MADDADIGAVRLEMARLRSQVSDIEGKLSQMRQWELRQQQLADEVAEAQREMGTRLAEQRGELGRAVEQVRSAGEEARARLGRRVRWLERRVRAIAGTPTVSLDATPDVTALAAQAARGDELRRHLLDPAARAAKQVVVDGWERWRTEWRAAVIEVVAASRAIAASPPDDPDRPAGAARYRAARSAVAALREAREPTRLASERAHVDLAAADEVERRHGPEIDAGEQAAGELAARLRATIEEAIGREELLPLWFESALGPGPPQDADGWLAVGTELLVHRATYGITDPIAALGPVPDPDAPAHHHTAWDALAGRLQRYR